ncbi:hypothetical protein V1504DRAFT_494242 [Lipomyces starkeyi]
MPATPSFCNLIRAYVSHPSRHVFTHFDNLKGFLEERAAALINGNGPQYVAILNFIEDDLLKLESSGLRREFPGFRVLLDEEIKMTIIKLMPGIPHEVATWIFGEIFLEERARLGLSRNIFVPTGSGRYHFSNELSPDHLPSFIVEVGVSQSLLQLRQDAQKVQLVTYDNNTQQVTGDPLILPINLLLDVVPSHVPSSEISISRQELLSYGADLFNLLR